MLSLKRAPSDPSQVAGLLQETEVEAADVLNNMHPGLLVGTGAKTAPIVRESWVEPLTPFITVAVAAERAYIDMILMWCVFVPAGVSPRSNK